MKQKPELSQEQKLSHQISMQLMNIGQSVLEINSDYRQSLSRQANERVRQAAEILLEVAKESMTEMTAERMQNWEEERNKNRMKFSTPTEGWEKMTDEDNAKWRREVIDRCHRGFGGGQV